MTFPVLSIPPLVAGATVSRQWPVEIFRAGNGSESRASILTTAQGVRWMRYQLAQFDQPDVGRLLTLFEAANERLVYTGDWTLATRLTEATSGGAVQVLNVPHKVAAGAFVLLYQPDGRTGTYHAVTSLSGGIVLDPAPSASQYPAGSWLLPAVTVFSEGAVSRLTTFDQTGRGEFDVQELQPVAVSSSSIGTTYLGRWVFGQGTGYEGFVPRRAIRSTANARNAMTGQSWQRRTRTKVEPLEVSITLQLFLRAPVETGLVWNMQEALKGQTLPLWVRSYTKDLDVTAIVGDEVACIDKGDSLFFDRDRFLWDRENSTGHRVTDVDVSTPGEMVLTVDPAPSADAVFETLYCARLAGDAIAMSASSGSPGYWDCNLEFLELPREAPEPE